MHATLTFPTQPGGRFFTRECVRGYRFAFNGKEKVDEVYGDANAYDYGFRMYDPRVARFLSVDPLSPEYPWYTPYQFAGNKPVWAIDRDGLEEFVFQLLTIRNSRGKEFLYQINYKHIISSRRAVSAQGSFYEDKARNDINIDFERSFFVQHSRDIVTDPNDANYRMVKSDFAKSGSPSGAYGSIKFNLGTAILFDTYKGKTVGEVNEAFNSKPDAQKEQFDNIVGVLVNDPNAVMTVTGYASPKATQSDQNSDETQANNQRLSEQRASATKDFIIQYALEKYDKTIDPNRITAVGGGISPRAGSEDSNSNQQEDRVVGIKVTVP